MPISLKQFLGYISTASNIAAEVEAGIFQTRMSRLSCGGILHRIDDETAICQGAFRNPLDQADFGPNLVLAVFRTQIVGFDHHGTLYLDSKYRGRGLGPEMIAQLYLLDGPEIWLARHRRLTAAGLIAHERAYELLLERGFL